MCLNIFGSRLCNLPVHPWGLQQERRKVASCWDHPGPAGHLGRFESRSINSLSRQIFMYILHISFLSYIHLHLHVYIKCTCIVSYHFISFHFISYHIISFHVISYHIISYHSISICAFVACNSQILLVIKIQPVLSLCVKALPSIARTVWLFRCHPDPIHSHNKGLFPLGELARALPGLCIQNN